MTELHFQITGVEAASHGMVPLLQFHLGIACHPPQAQVQSVILRVQIQFAAPQRNYGEREKERLVELFGPPSQWSRTLRNRLWTHVSTSVGAFTGSTEVALPVPCSFDLNVAAAKYLHALEDGEVPLLFLFSGTVFYAGSTGGLQVHQIPWDKECSYRMPVRTWRDLMDEHFPNAAWVSLSRDSLERLYAYRRKQGLGTWEETMERLLTAAEPQEVRT
jgi:hypothetical protein